MSHATQTTTSTRSRTRAASSSPPPRAHERLSLAAVDLRRIWNYALNGNAADILWTWLQDTHELRHYWQADKRKRRATNARVAAAARRKRRASQRAHSVMVVRCQWGSVILSS